MHREGGLERPCRSRSRRWAELHVYYRKFIQEHQKNPGDDLMGALITAELRREDGTLTRLSFDELLGFCCCSATPATRPLPA